MIGSPDSSFVPQAWQGYLIFVAISTFAVMLNIFGYRILGVWNEGACKSGRFMLSVFRLLTSLVFWSITACVVISITILSTSSKNTGAFVFTDFSNSTGWSDGVAWIIGLLQSALSLIGYDAVAHMMEEMPRPKRDAPIAMLTAVGIGGVTYYIPLSSLLLVILILLRNRGIFFVLVILFCLTNIQQILSTKTGMPITELIFQSTGSRAAAVVLTCALAVCFVNGAIGGIASGSRLLWSMARDNGTPFSS